MAAPREARPSRLHLLVGPIGMTAVDESTRLVEIMRRLRTQCPWDRSQTHETLRVYLLEETYEVLNALDGRRWDNLREELGDLFLQIVFHACIAEDSGLFNMHDVLRDINEKLVRRHPHVFGDKQVRRRPTTCGAGRASRPARSRSLPPWMAFLKSCRRWPRQAAS